MGFGALGIVKAVGTGLSELGDRKSARTAGKQAKKREINALGELSPASIMNLLRMFYSQYYAQLAPQLMGAQGSLDSRAARTGLSHSGVFEQLRAGLPGQFSNIALQQGLNSALPVAAHRADIRMQRPIAVGPSGYGIIGDMLQSFASMGMGPTTPGTQGQQSPSGPYQPGKPFQGQL